jgi:cytochrome c peroxidase
MAKGTVFFNAVHRTRKCLFLLIKWPFFTRIFISSCNLCFLLLVLQQMNSKKTVIIGTLATAVIFAAGFTNADSSVKTKADLGKMLFSEKMLSRDSSLSCASCHKPAYGFADTVAFSTGIGGKLTKRNTPSVLNMALRPYFFWDGRAASLEQQALMPIQNPDEMDLPVDEALRRLNEDSAYSKLFYKIFKQRPNAKNLAAAFAAYERTLETSSSKFDDWTDGKVKLTASEERGRQLFTGSKAKCFDCHFTVDFTADEYRNIGLYNGKELSDKGRYGITGKKADLGKFKTPGLRNIAATAPYMHNGMFTTLEEVVDYYNNPQQFVKGSINTDPLVKKPLGLTEREKKDIVAFLKTLTDRQFLGRKDHR